MDNTMTVLLILLVLIVGNIIAQIIHIEAEENNACQELGFEKSIYNQMQYCEDSEGNLHYVKMECKPWYWYQCTAKSITVGDVRVR